MDATTRDYINRGRHTVPGWFERLDAFLFATIDDAHAAAGVTGDLLEIGTYMGRSAVLLGYLQRPGERLVVCDIFDGPSQSAENEAENNRWYPDLSRHAFEENFQRFHGRLPDHVVAAPSVTLRGRELGYGKTFRFIHIDGSHEYAAVRSDLSLSRELLCDGGMVVFDDINGRHTPGVSAAVWGAVVNDGLIPHFLTTKLYASWSPIPPVDLTDLAGDWMWEPPDVAGNNVFHIEDVGSRRQRLWGWIPPLLVPTVKTARQRMLHVAAGVGPRLGRRPRRGFTGGVDGSGVRPDPPNG